MPLDDREVGLEPTLLNIGPAVELLDLLALGEIRAIGRRGVEGRNTGATGADALRERSLGNQFEFDLAGEILLRKNLGIG
jgi:hypothetical protein